MRLWARRVKNQNEEIYVKSNTKKNKLVITTVHIFTDEQFHRVVRKRSFLIKKYLLPFYL